MSSPHAFQDLCFIFGYGQKGFFSTTQTSSREGCVHVHNSDHVRFIIRYLNNYMVFISQMCTHVFKHCKQGDTILFNWACRKSWVVNSTNHEKAGQVSYILAFMALTCVCGSDRVSLRVCMLSLKNKMPLCRFLQKPYWGVRNMFFVQRVRSDRIF